MIRAVPTNQATQLATEIAGFCNKICHSRPNAPQQKSSVIRSPRQRSMIEAVTIRPSDFAVCRLIISSNRMGPDGVAITSPATRSGETRGPRERSAQRATVYKTIRRGLRRQVPLQEGARPVDGAGLQLRRILPGKHRDLGVRRQRGNVDRNLERMRRHVVGQHQHRRLA